MPTKLDIVNAKAKKYGYGRVSYSTRPDKRFMITYRGKKVHFGHPSPNSFVDHADEQRRLNYRRRHRGVMTKQGKEAYRVRGSPSALAYYLLW